MANFLSGRTLAVVVILTVLQCHGFQFDMQRLYSGPVCGLLSCSVHADTSPYNITYITELDIYNGSNALSSPKLASISVFDNAPHTSPANLAVNGSANTQHAFLQVSLVDPTDCETGVFSCQLRYMDTSSSPHSDLLTINAKDFNVPDTCSATCEGLVLFYSEQFQKLRARVDTCELDSEAKLRDATQKIGDLEFQLLKLGARLAQLEDQMVIPSTASSSTVTPNECAKGMVTSPGETERHVQLWGSMDILCDTVTDGGGWYIIQRRVNGGLDFNKNWNEYKYGFGDLKEDFWIGNEYIHKLTTEDNYELRVDMGLNQLKYHAQYSTFIVGDQNSNYNLTIGGYQGNAGDSFQDHNHMLFSTADRDNDLYLPAAGVNNVTNCALVDGGGWWYKKCFTANLNGQWGVRIKWNTISTAQALTFSEMKVRKKNV